MQEVTVNEFLDAMEKGKNLGTRYYIENADEGTVYLYLPHVTIDVGKDRSEIEIYVPHQHPEVFVGMANVTHIYRRNGGYRLQFNAGLSDLIITEEEKQ